MTDPRAQLPAVQRLITDELVGLYGSRRVLMLARRVIDDARERVTNGEDVDVQLLEARLRQQLRRGMHPVINATGIVVHTNLGRAPWSKRAVQRAVAATGYCNLELDMSTGGRGGRGAGAEERLRALTGAGGVLVVNNCAAAVVPCLRELARGK